MREDWQGMLKRVTELLAERDQKVVRQGGMTPPDLQHMAGEYAELTNPAFQERSLPQIVETVMEEWNTQSEDERVLAAYLVITLMHHAHINVYDLYQATIDVLEQTMQDTVTLITGGAWAP